ncbi:MAG TPA: hypothetical protein VFB30_02395 [Spirochaetia bacterium]|nr:hypothetical protein [Spirochaetia bacterium]
MKRLWSLVCAIVVLFACTPLFAADSGNTPSQYTLGDQTMSINAGLFIPLFLLPTGTVLLAGSPPHLSLGGVGSLSWAAYIAPQVRIGAEIGGSFTFDPNLNALLMLPILVKGTYVFSLYPFEIPVTLATGMNILSYVDQHYIDFVVRPGASLYYMFNASWSFGVNLNYWIDMQFSSKAGQSRTGNFLETSLSALYHY